MLRYAVVTVLASIVWIGCGAPPDAPSTEGSDAIAPRPVESLEPRVVAVAPSAVEQLFALGLGDHVVGVGDYATWPEAVDELPRLGGLYDFRLEQIIELEPDLAVLVESEVALRERLENLGIEVLAVPSETLGDVAAGMGAIGERFGLDDGGHQAVELWRRMLQPRPEVGDGLDVLVTIGREPGALQSVLVAGGDTFVDELLARLGASNVFADDLGEGGTRYPQVGLDAILDRSPDVILELRAEPLGDGQRSESEEDWARLNAAWTAGICVESIEGSHTLLAGPRLPQLYNELSAALVKCRG